jgi:hypothetical protein
MRGITHPSGRFALVASLPFVAWGCARISATTELHPDGTITRRLEFHAPAGEAGQGASIGPKADDIFTFPGAPAWTVTRTKKDQELILKAERTLKASDMMPSDVKLKGAKGAALVTNTLSVKQVAPGRWEYRETLHWNGDRPDDLKRVPAEAKAAFKEALPAALATPENIQSLGEVAFRELWRALFGPGDPLLAMALLHPDLAERKVIRRIGAAMNTALVEKFGDKLTQDQRGAIVKRLVQKAMADTTSSSKSKADPQGAQSDDPGAMTAMMFVVKLPGKIVSTNGERDEVTGEVYWALYAEAAAVGDVTMTAVCEK